MFRKAKKVAVAFILGVSLFFTWNVNCVFAGGGGPAGALESTQLVNKAQLIKQVAEAVEQTVTQIKQYENMLLNTLKLGKATWADATKDLVKLRNLLQSAESLTFALSFDSEKFDTRYPGYRSISDIDYPTFYKNKTADWQSYYRAAMEANHLEAKRILDEQAFLNELHNAANNAVGQNQMIQAANQIAVYMAQQMTQLRLDLHRQIESQSTYMLDHKQNEVDEQVAWEEAVGTWRKPSTGKSY